MVFLSFWTFWHFHDHFWPFIFWPFLAILDTSGRCSQSYNSLGWTTSDGEGVCIWIPKLTFLQNDFFCQRWGKDEEGRGEITRASRGAAQSVWDVNITYATDAMGGRGMVDSILEENTGTVVQRHRQAAVYRLPVGQKSNAEAESPGAAPHTTRATTMFVSVCQAVNFEAHRQTKIKNHI